MPLNLHTLGSLRSLAYHRRIAQRMADDPTIVARAKARVESWTASGNLHPDYARRWRAALDGPACELVALLTAMTEEAIELRQCTPFVGVLGARERWQLWRSVRAEAMARADDGPT